MNYQTQQVTKTKQTLFVTFDFMREIYHSADIKVNRYFQDFFADRILQASTESTLMDAMERLSKSVNVTIGYVKKDKVTNFIKFVSSPEASTVLKWIRRHPKLTAMIIMLKENADYQSAISDLEISEETIHDNGSLADPKKYIYKIPITVELLSPLSHGADIKAGNATLFRRKQIITSSGAIKEMPFYGGNALRGKMRDLLADDFLSLLGLIPRRDKPPISLWFFHAIYSGGVLEEQSKVTEKIDQELGKHGALKTDGIRNFRDKLPFLSLLGCAIGNRIPQGRIMVNDLLPRCQESGNGNSTISELIEWSYLTRHDNYEGREESDAHTGMIANTEVLKTGTILDGGIDHTTHIRDIELSALGRGINLLIQNGMLGAQNRSGLGKVAYMIENIPDENIYLDWIANNKNDVIDYMKSIGALNNNFDNSSNNKLLFGDSNESSEV